MSNISFAMGMFPIKFGRNDQWEHLFSMCFDVFNDKMISQWEHHIPVITCDEGIRCHLTRIYLFYFDDNFS